MNADDYLIQKAEEWFKKGDSDLRSAGILMKDEQPPTDTICFHCQQAAEKYLKGYLTLKGIDFIKSHDLDYLLKLCIDTGGEFETLRDAVLTLNKYGIEPRYPADIPVFYSVEEATKAKDLAIDMMRFIKAQSADKQRTGDEV